MWWALQGAFRHLLGGCGPVRGPTYVGPMVRRARPGVGVPKDEDRSNEDCTSPDSPSVLFWGGRKHRHDPTLEALEAK